MFGAADRTIATDDPDGGRNAPEWSADSRLIAAAPDLLAALRDVVRTCRPVPMVADAGAMALRAGRAAIAKAEGR